MAWAAAGLLAVAAAPVAGADDGVARLEGVGRALRRQAVWRASYHQSYVPAGMTRGEEQQGSVWVAWPDRALFAAGAPPVRQLGLEGRRVRLLDLEVPSCDDHELTDDEWARVPLAAVLDPSGAVERFVVSAAGERRVVLVPLAPGGVARVELEVDAAGMPVEVVVVDPQGAVNRVALADWAPGAAPTWLPQPPPGLECVVGDE